MRHLPVFRFPAVLFHAALLKSAACRHCSAWDRRPPASRCWGRVWLVALFALLVTAQRAPAQTKPAPPKAANQSFLQITVSPQNKIDITLEIKNGAAHKKALTDALRLAFHSELQNVRDFDIYPDDEDDTSGTPTVFIDSKWNAPSLQRGLRREASFDPAPLLKALHDAGVESCSIFLDIPKRGEFYCTGARLSRTYFSSAKYARYNRGVARYAIRVPTQGRATAPLRFGYGYRPEMAARTFWLLLALFLVPILATFWLRTRALNAKNADPTAVWFGFMQTQGWLATGFWYVWAACIITSSASDMLDFGLNVPRVGIASPTWIFLLLVPPALVSIANAALSQPVYSRIRGIEYSPASLAKRAAWTSANNYLPINFTMYGLFSLTRSPREAVLWFIASFVIRMVCSSRLAALTDSRPFALTRGELRDYIFGMANYAGVKLQHIFLLPTAKMQEANAFAAGGGNVLLTDYLLQNMTRREVNAIMAHELTHLRHRHPETMRLVLALVIYLPIGLLIVARALFPDSILQGPFWFPLAALGGLPIYFYISRRFEGVADAGAVGLTGDPEAMISGLSRLSRLNLTPLDWGRFNAGLVTHPSTRRRAQAIGLASGVPSARIDELLQTPLEGDRYPLPNVADDDERLFSKKWRENMSVRGMVLFLAAMLLPLLAVGGLAQRLRLSGAALGLAYLAGLVVACALYTATTVWFARWGMTDLAASLRRKLQPQLQADGVVNGELQFASFSPGGLPRSYGGYRAWDMGFLQIAPDALRYVGEQTQFALRPEQIVETRLVEGKANWWSLPGLAVAWVDEANYVSGVFTLRLQTLRSLARARRDMETLAQQIESWRRQATPAMASAPPSELGPPFSGDITGVSPSTLGTFDTLFKSLRIVLIVTFGLASLAGLRFHVVGGEPAAGWYALIGAALVTVFSWIPQWRYREPDAPRTPVAPARPPEPVLVGASGPPIVPPLPSPAPPYGNFDLS